MFLLLIFALTLSYVNAQGACRCDLYMDHGDCAIASTLGPILSLTPADRSPLPCSNNGEIECRARCLRALQAWEPTANLEQNQPGMNDTLGVHTCDTLFDLDGSDPEEFEGIYREFYQVWYHIEEFGCMDEDYAAQGTRLRVCCGQGGEWYACKET